MVLLQGIVVVALFRLALLLVPCLRDFAHILRSYEPTEAVIHFLILRGIHSNMCLLVSRPLLRTRFAQCYPTTFAAPPRNTVIRRDDLMMVLSWSPDPFHEPEAGE